MSRTLRELTSILGVKCKELIADYPYAVEGTGIVGAYDYLVSEAFQQDQKALLLDLEDFEYHDMDVEKVVLHQGRDGWGISLKASPLVIE